MINYQKILVTLNFIFVTDDSQLWSWEAFKINEHLGC